MTRQYGPMIALLSLVLACHPAGAGKAPDAARGPRVVLPSGSVVSLEVARTDEERGQGLMFRESMAEGAGMVFLFDVPKVQSFWMKNCHFPLDMIFTLSDGTVVDVLENVPPCSADPCPSYPSRSRADTVVELNAGLAKTHEVRPGKKLRYVEVPGR